MECCHFLGGNRDSWKAVIRTRIKLEEIKFGEGCPLFPKMLGNRGDGVWTTNTLPNRDLGKVSSNSKRFNTTALDCQPFIPLPRQCRDFIAMLVVVYYHRIVIPFGGSASIFQPDPASLVHGEAHLFDGDLWIFLSKSVGVDGGKSHDD